MNIQPVSDETSLNAARSLIREHFEAHSEAHAPSEIDEIISPGFYPVAPYRKEEFGSTVFYELRLSDS